MLRPRTIYYTALNLCGPNFSAEFQTILNVKNCMQVDTVKLIHILLQNKDL